MIDNLFVIKFINIDLFLSQKTPNFGG